ncbi:hypothetical protein [Nonomuraea sp. NPDC050783]|uniref:hypothetical protein n=1 Tax=Nonomuraea sp. NPDC050783 TaxID=3154634 RepID=UPI003467AFA3
MTIIIRHTHEDGTLVYGTRKGDGVFESGYTWPDKVKFTDIRAVECPHGDDGPAHWP